MRPAVWGLHVLLLVLGVRGTQGRGPWGGGYRGVLMEAARRLAGGAELWAAREASPSGDIWDWPLGGATSDPSVLLPEGVEQGPWGWLQREAQLRERTGGEESPGGEVWEGGQPPSLCANDTGEVILALASRATWAQRMVDATAKPPSGLVEGRLFWLGEYQECRAVRAVNLTRSPAPPLSGRYCTTVLPLQPGDARALIPGANAGGLRIGVCLPSTCSADDVTALLNSVLQRLNASLTVGLTSCQEDSVPWDAKALAALVVLAILALLLVAGTAYDVIVMQMPLWRQGALQAVAEDGGREGEEEPSVNIRDGKSGEHTPLLPPRSKFYQPSPGRGGQTLLAFSLYTNCRKLLSTEMSPGSLPCLHGIRFLSMTWVILGHTLAFGITLSENVVTYVPKALKAWSFQAISNATVAVDTFFCISGLLVMFLIMKELERKEGSLNWFLFYFHRFWRLTPAYMLILFLEVALFPHWGEGPNWPQGGVEMNNCSDTWWTNFLYVNNLIKPLEMCMSWSWYLANDMQFYVISPVLFMPLFYSKRVGGVMLTLALLTGVITPGVVSAYYALPARMETPGVTQQAQLDYFTNYYITPWCRWGPYVVGMATGYLLFRTKGKVMMSKRVAVLGWCVATGSALAVLYGLYDSSNGHVISTEVAALYNALARTVWGAAVAWVIVACTAGKGGPVNAVLCWPALVPLSRLTYCAYLVHPVLMNVYYFSLHRLVYLTDVSMAHLFLGHLVAAYSVALLCSLTLEAPALGLERALLRQQSATRQPLPNGATPKSSGF